MLTNVRKGQTIYHYRSIHDRVEKGIVENPKTQEIVVGSATPNPRVIGHTVRLVQWKEYVFEDGTTSNDFGSSSAMIENCFETAEEAFADKRNKIEAYEKELRDEITDLEALLNFPLKHCLNGEDPDYFALKVYKDAIEELKNFKGVIPNK